MALFAQEVAATAGKIGYNFNRVDAPKNDKDRYVILFAEFVVTISNGGAGVRMVNGRSTDFENATGKINKQSLLPANIYKLRWKQVLY